MPKELGLFYVALLTVQLCIQLDQFIIVQVTLPTLYHHPDTTPIKSIDDDEIYNLLEFLHSEHNDDLLDVDLQMLKD